MKKLFYIISLIYMPATLSAGQDIPIPWNSLSFHTEDEKVDIQLDKKSEFKQMKSLSVQMCGKKIDIKKELLEDIKNPNLSTVEFSSGCVFVPDNNACYKFLKLNYSIDAKSYSIDYDDPSVTYTFKECEFEDRMTRIQTNETTWELKTIDVEGKVYVGEERDLGKL